jgi:hypothetical protein
MPTEKENQQMSTLPTSLPRVNGDREGRRIVCRSPAPSATILIGSTEYRFDAETIADAEQVDRITQALQSATAASFVLAQILFWPEPFRTNVLLFLQGLEQAAPGRLRYVDGTPQSSSQETNLFDAALFNMCGHDDAGRCNRSITLAVAAAAIQHPDALRAACSRIRSRLKHLEVQGYRVDALIRIGNDVIRNGYPSSSETAPQDQVLVADALDDRNDLFDDLIVPDGWSVSANGISRAGSNPAKAVISAPIIITKRGIEIDGSAESVGISWPRDGRWVTRFIDRKDAFDRKSVQLLAQYGAPVTSNNAPDCVQFFADFEARNLDVLPVEREARSMGWHRLDGEYVFLWGRQVIRAASTEPGHERADASIVVRGSDEGDEQVLDGYHAHGTFEGWRAGISPLRDFPRAQLALYVSFASVLLLILRARNFVFSLAGRTSLGKTINLRVAASVWGCADETSPAAALGTWAATRTWKEVVLGILGSIVCILDETKGASDPKEVAQTVYDVVAGRGKGRGSLTGMRRSRTWNTVMLTSSEAPLTSFSKDGGTRGRVVECRGGPFGEPSPETASIVTTLNQRVCTHYGHAGPRWVAFLLANQASFPEWREFYERRRDEYQASAGSNPVAARLAASVAVIEVAAILCHQSGLIPWEYQNVVENFWPELIAETRNADTCVGTLLDTVGWANSHREQFVEDGRNDISPYSRGPVLGRWMYVDSDSDPNSACLCIIVPALKEVFSEWGLNYEETVDNWKQLRWLRTEDGRKTLNVRVAQGNRGCSPTVATIAIRWSVIDALNGPANGSDNDDSFRSGGPQRSIDGLQS